VTQRILALPSPTRVLEALRRQTTSPALDEVVVTEVLDRYGLAARSLPRDLGTGRRSRNVVVETDGGSKILKRYRKRWDASVVASGHSILRRLEELRFPAPRLVRTPEGATTAGVGGDIYALFDLIPGRTYGATYLRRRDRVHLMALAGSTLAGFHETLAGFQPDGRHHLGFVSPVGPRSRGIDWYANTIDELEHGGVGASDQGSVRGIERLLREAPSLLDRIGALEETLSEVDLPRTVIHGDYGLHNVVIRPDGVVVPIDLELARLDRRLNELILILGKHVDATGGLPDVGLVRALLVAYGSVFPLTDDERRSIDSAWRYQRLTSAVRFWLSAKESDAPEARIRAANMAIDRAGWIDEHPALVDELFGPTASTGARSASASSGGRAVAPIAAQAPTVMLVLRDLELGGAQATTRTLARYLPRAGFRVVVASFRDGPLRDEIEELGVPVELLPQRRHRVAALPWFLADMARLRHALSGAMQRHGADVVQIQTLGTLAFLVATLRFGSRAQVWWRIANVSFLVRPSSEANRWRVAVRRAAHRWSYRWGARLVTGIVAVSDEVAQAFRGDVRYRGDKLVVVLNGVDLERYPAACDRDEVRAALGIAPSQHLMTMVGTFKEQKGHRHLVDAAMSVTAAFPELRIVLVGAGDLERSIRAKVEEAGLSERVRLLGSRRDVPEILASSDSFVLPSLWEGFSVALLEAMATGLPIIATAVSGTNQVMVDGRTGWLVPPGDEAGLAAAMKELLSDPAGADARGVAARDRLEERFSARAQAEQLARLYRRAWAGPMPIEVPEP
jgi:glycosyltransferase involved in cell wall biosynthesis/Ser/Thr protein kinase RdoA (MazF antagonist)